MAAAGPGGLGGAYTISTMPSAPDHRFDPLSGRANSQAPYQQHLGGNDDVGTSPSQFTHNRGQGRRDVHTDTHRDHHWSFDEREADDDDGGYAMMGGPIKSPSNIERFRQARQRGMS